MEFGLIVAGVLVIANGFFVAVEFSATRARETHIRELVEEGRRGARSAHHVVERLDAYLSACQLGITMASLGLGAVGEPAFHDLLDPLLGGSARIVGFGLASAIAFLTITTLHVVIGELSPKSLAISRTEPVLLRLAAPMRLFYYVTRPLVDAFNWMGNVLLKPFGIPPASEAGHQSHSEKELRELLRQSSREGLIQRDEQELSEAALVYGDRRAREVMRPRGDIDYVTAADDVREVARRAVESGRTRLPLLQSDGELESAVGVVNAKDLLPIALGEAERAKLRPRPLAHVAESARVDEVLREMRVERIHLGLVHDEHGTVVGLITMEDIIEELLGEIEDEFDPGDEELIRKEGDTLHVDGAASVRRLGQMIGFEPESSHEATVGGYVTDHLGRVPEPDEVIEVHGSRLQILEVDGTRISNLRVLSAPDRDTDTSEQDDE